MAGLLEELHLGVDEAGRVGALGGLGGVLGGAAGGVDGRRVPERVVRRGVLHHLVVVVVVVHVRQVVRLLLLEHVGAVLGGGEGQAHAGGERGAHVHHFAHHQGVRLLFQNGRHV